MESAKIDIRELHWLIDMLQSIDVGLIILDEDFLIQNWNKFMQSHSGLRPDMVLGKDLFESFPDLPQKWLRRKVDSVFALNSRAFTTWEQRPYLFKFKNYRPITGSSEFMYQNITFIPVTSVTGKVDHVGILIYDVTDIAINKKELQEANKQLEQLSRTDHLTQLNNRRFWDEYVLREFRRFGRTKQPCALALLDIDHFKNINDTYGHQVGDEVLRHMGRLIRETARTTDIAGRYGGEEFGVLLINTTAKNAIIFAERLRSSAEKRELIIGDAKVKYTISIGIAELTLDITEEGEWVSRADKALYEAKRSGRNQVKIFKVEAESDD